MRGIYTAVFIGFVTFVTSIAFGQERNSFLEAPDIVFKADYKVHHHVDNRKFTGIPSLAVTPKGTIWIVWYAGITADEDENNYVVLAYSDDQGKTWEEVLVVDPDGPGPVRAFDPEIWMDPNGKLWVFWAQTIGKDGSVAGVWAISNDDPDSPGSSWTRARRLTDGVMMCKPLVMSSGEWVLPASTWRMTDNSARAVVSSDNGQTWELRGAVDVPKENRVFDEHMIVERKDGSLWMLLRTNYGIGESESYDSGRTWSPLRQSLFAHPSARFFISKLNSGSFLLVKHGPLTIPTGRSHLMAFISQDEGRTWSNGLLLDERPGVSYPDGQQTSEGMIYITYDFDRRNTQQILMTSFQEEDIIHCANDRMIYKTFLNRKIITRKLEE